VTANAAAARPHKATANSCCSIRSSRAVDVGRSRIGTACQARSSATRWVADRGAHSCRPIRTEKRGKLHPRDLRGRRASGEEFLVRWVGRRRGPSGA
jgi:hypothetical protein